MKNKKLMLIATAAMGFVALGTAGVGTMAWYQTTAATAKENAGNIGTLTIHDSSESLNDVHFVVSVHTGAPTSLIYTNRTGRSYMRAGDVYTEVAASDDGSTCGANKKQGSTTWDVKITNAAENAAAATDSLASIAGDYVVKVTAAGSAKLSLTQTSSLGTDAATPVVNFSNTGITPASGALGAAASQVVEVMTIRIAAAGTVTYSVDGGSNFSAWANTNSAVQSATTYYGLEVLNATAEATPALADGTALTSSVWTGGSEITAA